MQDAQRLINVIRKAIEKQVGTVGLGNYRYGVAGRGGGAYEVSAYLDGDTSPTAYIRQIAGSYVAEGDPIVVVTTPEGDAWIDQVIPNPYSAMAIDHNRARILIGDGTSAPDDPGQSGFVLTSGGTSAPASWAPGGGGTGTPGPAGPPGQAAVAGAVIVVHAAGGTTDDAPALRAAVNGASPGTTIFLPDPLYLLKSSVDNYGVGTGAAVEIHKNNIRFVGAGGIGNINNVTGPDSTVIQASGMTGDMFRWVADEGSNNTDQSSMIRMGGINDCFLWGNATARRCLDLRGGVRGLSFKRSTFSHATQCSIVGGDKAVVGSEGWHGTFVIDFEECNGSVFASGADVVWLNMNSYAWRFDRCSFATGDGYCFNLQGCDDIYINQSFVRAFSGGKSMKIWPRDPLVSPTPLASSIIVVNSFGFDNIEAPAAANQLPMFNGQFLMLGVPTTDAGTFGAAHYPEMGAGRHIWYLDDQGRNNFRRDIRISTTLYDDFIVGSSASGDIGGLRWLETGTGGAIYNDGTLWGSSGRTTLQMFTNIAIDSTVAIGLRAAGSGLPVQPSSSFIEEWMIALGTGDSDTTFRFGLMDDYTADPPANGIYFEKLAADTGLYAVTRKAGVQTRTLILSAPITDWHRYTILRQSATDVGFYLDDITNWDSTVDHTTNVPIVALGPAAFAKTAVAASKGLYIDAYQLTINGLAR